MTIIIMKSTFRNFSDSKEVVACSKLGSCRRPTDPSDPEVVQKQELQKGLWIKGTVQSDVVVCSGGRHAAQEVRVGWLVTRRLLGCWLLAECRGVLEQDASPTHYYS